MLSAEQANQYPPEAARSSIKQKTGKSFSAAKSLILFAIKADWTGEPPGEFIINDTALTFLNEKAFVIESDKSFRFRLPLPPSLLSADIIPDNLIRATTDFFENKIFPQWLVLNL